MGRVLVRDGRIEAVGPAAELRAQCGFDSLQGGGEHVRSFPGCVLLPGLVNAHSHLDYSAFQGFSPSCGFGEWMLRLLRSRRKLTSEDYAASARWGAEECARNGITCIADTSFEGSTVARAAGEAGLRARVYLEVIGLDEAELPAIMERTEERLSALGPYRTSLVDLGLSPHAPYTVSWRLYREIARYADREGLHLATHVAESPAEVEFLERGAGSIARAYKAARSVEGRPLVGARPAPGRLPGLRRGPRPGDPGRPLRPPGRRRGGRPGRRGCRGRSLPALQRPSALRRRPRRRLRRPGSAWGWVPTAWRPTTVWTCSPRCARRWRADPAAARHRGARTAAHAAAPTEPAAEPLTPADVLRMATLEGARASGLGRQGGQSRGREAGRHDRGASPRGRLPHRRRYLTAEGMEAFLVSCASGSDVQATLVDGRFVFERHAARGARSRRDRRGL